MFRKSISKYGGENPYHKYSKTDVKTDVQEFDNFIHALFFGERFGFPALSGKFCLALGLAAGGAFGGVALVLLALELLVLAAVFLRIFKPIDRDFLENFRVIVQRIVVF